MVNSDKLAFIASLCIIVLLIVWIAALAQAVTKIDDYHELPTTENNESSIRMGTSSQQITINGKELQGGSALRLPN